VIDDKLQRKLRKFCKWARRHGYRRADMFVTAPDELVGRWYVHASFESSDGCSENYSKFIEEGELDG